MFAKKGFNVFENTFATTVNEFVIKELVKVSIYLSIENDLGPKRPRAETTHLPRPKRPILKIGRNDPGRNDPAETTQGRNDPEPQHQLSFAPMYAIQVQAISQLH